jgi:hypothetical protein
MKGRSAGANCKIWVRYFTSGRNDSKNCCLREESYPTQIAIAVGAVMMLLKNFIVDEWHTLNGSIGAQQLLILSMTIQMMVLCLQGSLCLFGFCRCSL